MNTATAATVTATSLYGTVREVTITATGTVYATNGALMGDVDGMERIGWEFGR